MQRVFFDEHREPFAAISISGPISRITDDRVTEFGAMVIKSGEGSDAGVRWNALTFFWRAEAIFCPSYLSGNRIRVSVNRIDARIT
ncbi:hypothetical protein ACP0HM_25525 [Escherichia coli]